MELPQFMAANPITDENGVVFDKYWLVSMVISTNLTKNIPSLYAEFWPCRDIWSYGVKSKEIKYNVKPNEIKSFTIDDIFAMSEVNPGADSVISGLLQFLNQIGIQYGFLKGE